MSTRALGGKTPWQTLYRLPPNLSRSKRFGEAVWVHNPNESKLNPRACKGCWIGFNVKSHGHRVYWPTNKTVSIECSVYFAAADRLEGEKMDVPSSKALTSELLAALLCQEAALTRRVAWRRSGGRVGLGPSGKQLHPATPELTAWRERPADSSQ